MNDELEQLRRFAALSEEEFEQLSDEEIFAVLYMKPTLGKTARQFLAEET